MMRLFADGELVDNACQNENCSEHMIAKRYPATMVYVINGEIVCYYDIAMRCVVCGSLYPPANESQLEDFTGFHTVRNLPTGDQRTESVGCPKEHMIRREKNTLIVSCGREELARATFSYDEGVSNGEPEIFIKSTMKDHNLEYLQQAFIILRQAVGELEALRKHCIEHHEQGET